MESFLRKWQQDATDKRQFDSAIFVGDKLWALTSTILHNLPFFLP